MTLGFSIHWPDKMGELAGKPTYFIQKIWNGLIKEHILDVYDEKEIHREYYRQFDEIIEFDTELPPKLHTIRRGNRWRKGMKIHMTIHNRTKKRFQFAPVLECTGVQNVEIDHWWYDEEKTAANFPTVKINGKSLEWKDIENLALNDGFPSVEDFFKFFDSDFKGQIIHWAYVEY